ncbi:non-specific protein-tyrosine kinase [Balamuthia mandrillaris]
MATKGGKRVSKKDDGGASTLSVMPYYELSPDDIHLSSTPLASGAFGTVFKGSWHGVDCCVKKLHLPFNDPSTLEEFEREAALMEKLGRHPNVISFFGAVTLGEQKALVTEFAEKGSLYDFLIKNKWENKGVSFPTIIKLLKDAALGIDHLHREKVIHRDIAARNVLVKGPPYTALVTDFGLSRILTSSAGLGITKCGLGPVPHMAPESLESREYSVKSDSWSFGVMIWEVVTRQRPWVEEGKKNETNDMLSLARRIAAGEHPPIPEDADYTLAFIMRRCFSLKPEERPTMTEIWKILSEYEEKLLWEAEAKGETSKPSPKQQSPKRKESTKQDSGVYIDIQQKVEEANNMKSCEEDAAGAYIDLRQKKEEYCNKQEPGGYLSFNLKHKEKKEKKQKKHNANGETATNESGKASSSKKDNKKTKKKKTKQPSSTTKKGEGKKEPSLTLTNAYHSEKYLSTTKPTKEQHTKKHIRRSLPPPPSRLLSTKKEEKKSISKKKDRTKTLTKEENRAKLLHLPSQPFRARSKSDSGMSGLRDSDCVHESEDVLSVELVHGSVDVIDGEEEVEEECGPSERLREVLRG